MGIVYILYALYPTKERIDAFKFFLKHVFNTKHNLKVVLIENKGPETLLGKLESDVIFMQRENVNGDFAAWAYAVEKMNLELNKDDYLFLINDTVYGPFVKPGVDWVDLFINAFNPDVALVTTTICCHLRPKLLGLEGRSPYPIALSMCFMINKLGWKALMKSFEFIKDGPKEHWDVAKNCEFKLSQRIFEDGFNINTMLMGYADVDYRKHCVKDDGPHSKENIGDTTMPLSYFETSIHPLEAVFIKWNRGRTDIGILKNYISWMDRNISYPIKSSTIYIMYALYPDETRIKALRFFLNHIFKTKHKLKITVVENLGPMTVGGSLPVSVDFMQRENVNGDFGAWAYAVDNLGINLGENDYLMLVNDTVYGPIVKPGVDWADLFLASFLPEMPDSITGSSTLPISTKPPVALVSTTICCHTLPEVTKLYGRHPFPTIQSMCFMINNLGWKALMETFDLVKEKKMEHWEMAVKCEFGISKRLFDQGLNINCMLMGYSNFDYLNSHVVDESSWKAVGETSYPGCYFGTTIHPLEVVFVKWNRGRTDTRILNNYVDWMDGKRAIVSS